MTIKMKYSSGIFDIMMSIICAAYIHCDDYDIIQYHIYIFFSFFTSHMISHITYMISHDHDHHSRAVVSHLTPSPRSIRETRHSRD